MVTSPDAEIPIAIRAPQANRQTVFQSSHSLRCRDSRCVAENHATSRRRLEQLWLANACGATRTARVTADSIDRPAEIGDAGNPLVASPAAAQAELVALARRWTRQYAAADPNAARPGRESERPTIFLSGHQPELFHPGVWYKNFVLAAAARQTNAIGINLLIDQDLVKSNALVVPTASPQPHPGRIPFDYGGVGLPFEERQVEHPDVLRTFPHRIAAAAAAWVQPELVWQLWPDVIQWSRELQGLGYGFAAARHRREQQASCHNLEVPLSWVCQTASFAQFVVQVLASGRRFVAAYNDCLDQYRRWYGISGNQRPMPDLVVHDQWFELPFWLWTAQHPWRKRLMVRRTIDGWQLSVATGSQVDLAAWRLDLAAETAVEQLQDFSRLKIRLRPRALMTTLYSRGVLAQAFLHGIGGALYDQMTDRLARSVFDWRLPDYAIATATLHLGESNTPVAAGRRAELQRYLRDLRFNPERIPAFAQQYPQWVADKRQLLAAIPPPRHRAAWQRQIEQLLADARRWTTAELAATQEKLAKLVEQLQQQDLLTYREWSFVLFPDRLPTQLQEMATAEFGLC